MVTDADRKVRLHLSDRMRQRIDRGDAPFLRAMMAMFHYRGFDVSVHSQSPASIARSALTPGYAVAQRARVWGPRMAHIHQVHIHGFWRIEASHDRRRWTQTRGLYEPAQIPPSDAAAFARGLRRQVPKSSGSSVREGGFILVPLQGKLTRHRTFQSMSPIDMIRMLRARIPDRRVVLRLHPKETYGPAERQAIDKLCTDPMIELSDAPVPVLAQACGLIATQNSAAAFWGYVHHKPAVFFADTDLDAIAGSVRRDGLEAALARLDQPPPDYDDFVTWYMTRFCFCSDTKDLDLLLSARFRALGWPI